MSATVSGCSTRPSVERFPFTLRRSQVQNLKIWTHHGPFAVSASCLRQTRIEYITEAALRPKAKAVSSYPEVLSLSRGATGMLR